VNECRSPETWLVGLRRQLRNRYLLSGVIVSVWPTNSLKHFSCPKGKSDEQERDRAALEEAAGEGHSNACIFHFNAC
jgi:hypothetical protein